jgi:hypothetical protein
VGGDDAVLRIPTEHEEQRELVRWFRQTFRDVRIFAIPNGGSRGRAQGGRLKAEGVSAGVPDLLVPAWALWIEMKRTQGGSVSPEQRDWHAYLRSIGHTVLVCRGFLQAKEEIEHFLLTTRQT